MRAHTQIREQSRTCAPGGRNAFTASDIRWKRIDTSFVVLPAKRVTQLSEATVCVRVPRACASREEPGRRAKAAIKESKRRLRPLTSRLVSAFGFADDIPMAPRRASTVIAPPPTNTRNYPNALSPFVLIAFSAGPNLSRCPLPEIRTLSFSFRLL